MKKLILLMVVIMSSACSDTSRTSGGEVDAIYWHEGQRYTAKIDDGGGLIKSEKIPPWGHADRGAIKLYKDVDPESKSWYKCNWNWNGFSGASDGTCEIHVHSLDELGTADWNHGKFGSGSTTRID